MLHLMQDEATKGNRVATQIDQAIVLVQEIPIARQPVQAQFDECYKAYRETMKQ